jgi:hypothetical protein
MGNPIYRGGTGHLTVPKETAGTKTHCGLIHRPFGKRIGGIYTDLRPPPLRHNR